AAGATAGEGFSGSTRAVQINSGTLAFGADARNARGSLALLASSFRSPLTLAGGAIASSGLEYDGTSGDPTAAPVTAAIHATVNLGGSMDALSSGAAFVDVVNNSTTSLNVTAGSKNVGTISGVGNTNVSSGGASLTATAIRQAALNAQGNVTIRPNALAAGTSNIANLAIANGVRFNPNDNKLVTKNAVGNTI